MFFFPVERAPSARSLPEGVTLPHWLALTTAVAMRDTMERCLAAGGDRDAAFAEAMALILAQHPALPMPIIRDTIDDLLRTL